MQLGLGNHFDDLMLTYVLKPPLSNRKGLVSNQVLYIGQQGCL